MHCTGVMGQIPSLQCRLCVCLYHPECVGLGALADASQLSYVCQVRNIGRNWSRKSHAVRAERQSVSKPCDWFSNRTVKATRKTGSPLLRRL